MGLDMFAYKMKHKPSKEVDFQEEIQDVESVEVHYWRKHPNIHGWMENLYRSKGGEKEEFNCVPVVLNEEDLHQLAACIIDHELPNTSGFFFGESNNSEEEREDDLQFVKDSLKAIEEGYTVYYDSWW
jgi:hypothetical protein